MRIAVGPYPIIESNEEMRLVCNAIRCKKCNQVIESKSTHQFVQCSCGAVGVDGGLEYDRVMGDEMEYECLQEWLITEKQRVLG